MKITKIRISVLFITLASWSCKTPSLYELPADMKPEIRVEYATYCEKGLALYKINCAPCHDTVIKGKTVIPDFTQEQLKDYEFRFKNKTHEKNLTEMKLSQDELMLIITFLTYKKPLGIKKSGP